MIKFFIISLFFSLPVFAQDINCVLSEFSEGQNLDQSFLVTANPADPHGSMKQLEFKKFTQYVGFVALVKGYAVINVQTPDGSVMFTSQGSVSDVTSLQLLFPSKDNNPVGVYVRCGHDKR